MPAGTDDRSPARRLIEQMLTTTRAAKRGTSAHWLRGQALYLAICGEYRFERGDVRSLAQAGLLPGDLESFYSLACRPFQRGFSANRSAAIAFEEHFGRPPFILVTPLHRQGRRLAVGDWFCWPDRTDQLQWMRVTGFLPGSPLEAGMRVCAYGLTANPSPRWAGSYEAPISLHGRRQGARPISRLVVSLAALRAANRATLAATCPSR